MFRRRSSRGRALSDVVPGRWAQLAIGLLALGAGLVVLRHVGWGVDHTPAGEPIGPDRFDSARIDADRAYRRGLWACATVALVVPAAVAMLVALTGSRWRPAVVRRSGARPGRAGAIAGVGAAVVLSVVALPVALARFLWARSHGVVHQPVGAWLVDRGWSLLIVLVVFSGLGLLVALLLARWARAWWVAFAGVVCAFALVSVLASPVVVTPLFSSSTPVPAGPLRTDIESLAARAGVPVGDVRVSDASTRTRAANAAVMGVGATRRIVLDDTLLSGFTPREVRVVVAHELGHVRDHHVLKGVLWPLVLALPLAWLAHLVVVWRTGTEPVREGAAGCDLALRRLSIVAVEVALIVLIATPLANAVSRSFERQADLRALEWTGDPSAAVGVQHRLVTLARADPDPPVWVRVLFGTHPSAVERVALARAWETARDGPPRTRSSDPNHLRRRVAGSP